MCIRDSGMAAYAWHAARLGFHDPEVDAWFIKGMVEFAKDHSAEEWLNLLMEFGQINLKCMAILDKMCIRDRYRSWR